jgi:holliday junction DNA helicase RuvA
MIGFLKGQVIENADDSLVVEVAGVGYEVAVSQFTSAEYPVGAACQLFVYTHVREDQLNLYGFLNPTEKQFFLSLLKVNGIGPKMALNILSGASFDQIVERIENEDVKALSQLPKVGKKTAEQMILTLKGKLLVAPEGKKSTKTPKSSMQQAISSALVNLGFRLQDVEIVVKDLPGDIDLQEGVRRGLAALTT